MHPTPRTTLLRRSSALLCGSVVLAAGLALGGTPAGAADSSRADAPAQDTWWFSAMRLDDAHQEVTGRGVQVAVVDSGLDPTVPELDGADVSFGRTHCTLGPSMSKPAQGAAADHGTAMTALVAGGGAGVDGEGTGIMGVAPDASIRFYDNDSDDAEDNIQCGTLTETAETIRQAVKDGADIVNLSFGGGTSTIGKRILEKLVDEDVVLVAAAGTGGGGKNIYDYPGALPGVVAVNAVDQDAEPWSDNPPLFGGDPQFGYPVISAPGVAVEALGLSDTQEISGYERTGTSGATAIVSGALALVKEKYPDATANQLIQHLIHNSGGDGGYAWDADYGFGIVSATKMLASDPTEWPDENPLLNGPKRALKEYPMSVRGQQSDPSASPSDESSEADGGADVPSDEASDDANEAAATSGGGPGAGLWLGVGAAVLVAAGAGVFVATRRRGSSSTTGSRVTGGVTEGE